MRENNPCLFTIFTVVVVSRTKGTSASIRAQDTVSSPTEVRVEYVEIGVFLLRNISPQIRDPSVSAGIQHSIKGILPHHHIITASSSFNRNNDMVRLPSSIKYDDDDESFLYFFLSSNNKQSNSIFYFYYFFDDDELFFYWWCVI